jgi:hypothetical protein
MYQNLIVRTRTPLAQLLPVLATVFGSELSTMIIISRAVHLDAHGAGSPDGDLRQGRGAQQARAGSTRGGRQLIGRPGLAADEDRRKGTRRV